MPTPPSRDPPGVKIGPDQVWFLSQKLVIYALKEFPDWEVRSFQRNPVYFQGRKYYLVHRSAGKPPHAIRYELAPWPEDLHDESKIHYTYDEAAVAERDQAHKMDHHEERIHMLLLPFTPFLGFCWSGFQEQVLARYGFNPTFITGASLLLMFFVAFVESIFAVFLHTGLLAIFFGPAGGWLDGIILVVTPFDCIIRYSQILRQVPVPDGWLEWLFRWKQREDH